MFNVYNISVIVFAVFIYVYYITIFYWDFKECNMKKYYLSAAYMVISTSYEFENSLKIVKNRS